MSLILHVSQDSVLAEGSEFGRDLHNPRRNKFDSLLRFRIEYLPTHVYLHFRHLCVERPTVWQALPVGPVKTACDRFRRIQSGAKVTLQL